MLAGARRFAGLAACFLLAAPATAKGEPVPETIVATLDRLRLDWPQTPQPQMRNGRRFDYYDGTIRVGQVTFDELEGAPENQSGVILSFLLGHEAWHGVQYAEHSMAEIRRMGDNRQLECEADFMGAAAAYRLLKARGLTQEALEDARRSLMRYVRRTAALAGDASSYPAANQRAETIAIGWGQAASPALIRYVGRGRVPSTEIDRAADICIKIVALSDGSVGGLEINWLSEPVKASGPTETWQMHAENQLKRAIVTNFIAIVWLEQFTPYVWPANGQEAIQPERPEPAAFEVIDITVPLAPDQKIDRTYDFRRIELPPGDGPESSYYSRADLRRAMRYSTPLVSSRYQTPVVAPNYCIDRISGAPRSADRLLLARLGTIALAARDDFSAIGSSRVADNVYGRTIQLQRALNFSGNDSINISSGSVTAGAEIFRDEADQPAIDEYARLRALLQTTCGAANIIDTKPNEHGEPSLQISNFAPYADIRMTLDLDRSRPWTDQTGPRTGGSIFLNFKRLPGL